MMRALVAAVTVWLAMAAPQPPVRVLMQTDAGDIELEIDVARAPITAANFLKYVDSGLYDGGRFHRTVRADNQRDQPIKIAVIQGAANAARHDAFFPPISLERTSATGLAHTDGTISMARDGADTATDEFFICLGDQPELDFGGKRNPDGQGFAAFGRVRRGMEVVGRIQMSAAQGEKLTPPVEITRVTRLR